MPQNASATLRFFGATRSFVIRIIGTPSGTRALSAISESSTRSTKRVVAVIPRCLNLTYSLPCTASNNYSIIIGRTC
jgi:hypothetical protein